MNVYTVERWLPWEGETTVGVYSDEGRATEKAKECARTVEEGVTDGYFRVYRWELDSSKEGTIVCTAWADTVFGPEDIDGTRVIGFPPADPIGDDIPF